jgi:gas vesicle protein
MIRILTNKHPTIVGLTIGVVIGFMMAMLLLPSDTSRYGKITVFKPGKSVEQIRSALNRHAHSEGEVNDDDAPLTALEFHPNATHSHAGYF